jgi:hypothetical protein
VCVVGSYMVPEVTVFGSYSGSLPVSLSLSQYELCEIDSCVCLCTVARVLVYSQVLTPVTGDSYALPNANYSGPDPHEFNGVG